MIATCVKGRLEAKGNGVSERDASDRRSTIDGGASRWKRTQRGVRRLGRDESDDNDKTKVNGSSR
jgi:hypothetical protein